MDYFDDLNNLSDDELERIYIKGENLHIPNSRASMAKRILDSRRSKSYIVNFPALNIPTFSVPSIVSANASLSALSDVNNSIKNIANAFSLAGVVPLTSVNTLVQNIESIQKIAGTTTWQDIAKNTIGSQILNTVNSIQGLNLQTIDTKKPQDLLPKKLAKEITSVKEQKSDTIFNFPAYTYIFNLEVYLRSFITKYIIEPNKHQLQSKIPAEMLKSWKEKKDAEESNKHVDSANYDLIEYSNFTDLKTILEKKTTISLVKGVISEVNLKTITSKLVELEPIRLKIAHSRALTEDEFTTLKFYSDKIKKVLS